MNDSDDNNGYSHHDLEVEMLHPDNLVIDNLNERNEGPGPRTESGNLEKSIEENGVQNPIQARPGDNDEYKVFAGQRRLLAARSVGLDEIPVIIKDLDDMEALAASVNENNEHLKKEVSRKDRASAVKTLVEKWGYDTAADEFGVEVQTIRNWLESTRNFWTDTIFDPEKDSNLDTEYIANDLLANIRRVTGSSKLAETIASEIIDKKIPPSVVRSAVDTTSNPENFWKEIQKQWKADVEGKDRVDTRVILVGENAQRLKSWAKNRGLNQSDAIAQIVTENFESDSSDIVNIRFDPSTSKSLREIEADYNVDSVELIKKIVTDWIYYLEEHEIDTQSVLD